MHITPSDDRIIYSYANCSVGLLGNKSHFCYFSNEQVSRISLLELSSFSAVAFFSTRAIHLPNSGVTT